MPSTGKVEYKYNERVYHVRASSNAGAAACLELTRKVIQHDMGSFATAPKQPAIAKNQQVFAMSYYFDRAVEIGGWLKANQHPCTAVK